MVRPCSPCEVSDKNNCVESEVGGTNFSASMEEGVSDCMHLMGLINNRKAEQFRGRIPIKLIRVAPSFHPQFWKEFPTACMMDKTSAPLLHCTGNTPYAPVKNWRESRLPCGGRVWCTPGGGILEKKEHARRRHP